MKKREDGDGRCVENGPSAPFSEECGVQSRAYRASDSRDDDEEIFFTFAVAYTALVYNNVSHTGVSKLANARHICVHDVRVCVSVC